MKQHSFLVYGVMLIPVILAISNLNAQLKRPSESQKATFSSNHWNC